MMTKLGIDGNVYHAELIASILKDTPGYSILRRGNLRQSDVLYWVMGAGPSLRRNPFLWVSGPKMIIHWIGSDVLWFTHPSTKGSVYSAITGFKKLMFKFGGNSKRIIHLAGSPWLVNELKDAGINAKYFPISTIDIQAMKELGYSETRDIDFITYAPLVRFEFYGGDKIMALASKMPQFSFVVICTDIDKETNIPDHPDNVVFYPKMSFIDVQKLFMRSRCLLRFTEHDGLSLSVLESLYHKLQVFWTYPFPNTKYVDNFDNITERMQATIVNWEPNEEGHRYVVDNFSIEKWKKDFVNFIKSLQKGNHLISM